jgi:DNA mismatch endonuclease (patch repair protein)
MDTLTPEERSERMSRIRSKNSKPEMAIRRLVHGMGYRYRLHARDLPGTPDLVFRSRKKVIFVHGCFWHGHECKLGRMPKSRIEFWSNKIASNRARDTKVLEQLREMGWSCLVIWECQLGGMEKISSKIKEFLSE